MEIPGSGVVNRYIAAQGPLPNTCKDFWQMIWEQQCRLVVMLTTKVTIVYRHSTTVIVHYTNLYLPLLLGIDARHKGTKSLCQFLTWRFHCNPSNESI